MKPVLVKKKKEIYCSFCGKEHGEVFMLVGGSANVFICDGCVCEANGVIVKARSDRHRIAAVKAFNEWTPPTQ